MKVVDAGQNPFLVVSGQCRSMRLLHFAAARSAGLPVALPCRLPGAVLRYCFGKLSLSGIRCSKALRSQ